VEFWALTLGSLSKLGTIGSAQPETNLLYTLLLYDTADTELRYRAICLFTSSTFTSSTTKG